MTNKGLSHKVILYTNLKYYELNQFTIHNEGYTY